MTITVSPGAGNTNTHHIKLTDADATELGLICCDSRGNRLAQAAVNPYPNFASQLRQGRGKHADRVPPFEDIPLSDFSGGMCMLHHDEDASKYLDGKRIDTSRMGEVVHSGLEHYVPGIRNFDQLWPGDVDWFAMYAGGTTSKEVSFVAGASYNVNSIVVILKKVGAPTGAITVSLRDSAGDLVSANTTKSLTIGTDCLTDLVSERVEFTFPAVAGITSTTTYKVRVAYSGGSAAAYVQVAVNASANPYYRVLDDTADFNGIFFELNGGFYFVTQPKDMSASKLYLYGDRGVADPNTGALTTLIDASKSAVWTADEWIGGVVKIVAEDGTEEQEPYRTITDSSTTTLTVSPAWNIVHTTETEYVIMYPEWKLVQTLSKYCTDVTVGPYFAVFAFGSGQNFQSYYVRETAGAFDETLTTSGETTLSKVMIPSSYMNKDTNYSTDLYGVYTETSVAWIVRYPLSNLSKNTSIKTFSGHLLSEPRPFNSTSYAGGACYTAYGSLLFGITAVNGTFAHLKLNTPVNIEGTRFISFYIDANGSAFDAGDISFGFADSAGNTKWTGLPALSATEPTECMLVIDPLPDLASNSYNPEDITDIYFKTTKSLTGNFYLRGDMPVIGLRPYGPLLAKQPYLPRNTQVTNIIEYVGAAGEITSRPWVFTWNGPWYESANAYTKLYLGELDELEHPDNGKGVCVNDVYLYFNVGQTIQRYYGGRLDSVGPDVDYGLPADRRGIPITAASYPGRVIYGIDAGAGTSSVIVRRNHGWYEHYRAPKGQRIRRIHALGRADTVDQLFVLEGADILWVPISISPHTDSDYEYTYESVLETSRIYGGLRETEKYYHALTLITEDLSTGHQYVEVDYRTSESSTWVPIGTTFVTSPRQQQSLISTNNVSGRWIQFRFRSYTDDADVTPKIVAAVVDSLERLDVNNMYSYTVRLDEGKVLDLQGTPETQTGVQKLTQLETWVDSPLPLTLNTTSGFEDGKLVFIEGMRKRVIKSKVDDNSETRLVDINLIEVS